MAELVSDMCLRTILEDGIPCPESLEELMRKLDVQLAFNRKQLEKCVNDVLNETVELPGSKTFTMAKDALEFMAENNVLEKTSCYDPDPDQVTRLLKHVLHVLDDHPSSEETVLQSLLQLSSEEGIILPIRSSVADQQAESMISINTVMDTTEHLNESLWAEICMRLRRYYVDKLAKLPVNVRRTAISLDKHNRLAYLQSLCSLYPSEDIWNRYRSLRSQQVDKSTNNLIVPHSGTLDLETTASNFEEFCNMVVSMIDEDFIVLNSGIFKHHVKPFNAINEVFLEKISDEIAIIVDTIQEEMMGAQASNRQSYPRCRAAQTVLTSLTPSGSKSMDSLLMRADEGSTDLVLPAAHVRALTKIISATHMVDCHVETLYQRMTWEVFGAIKKKHLKPSLKTGSGSGSSSSGKLDLTRRRPSLRSSETTAMLPDNPPPPFQCTESDTNLRVIEKALHEDKPSWQWREITAKLVPDLSRAMETIIRTTGTAALEDEWQKLQLTNDMETELLCDLMIGGRLDYPKCIAQSLALVIRETDMMLPLAATATDTCCHLLRTTFTECITAQMRHFHNRLAQICTEVPHKLPMKCIYVALASAAFIRNHLQHYDNVIATDDGSNVFSGLHRQFVELVERISLRVVEYNNMLISTCLLQDAESHHWNDTKEFYEDERCSFSVQMWNLHMKALQHDLWYYGPPKLGQAMLADILKQSLLALAQRYCQIKPSYKRTPQFRRDVISILLCTYHMLMACATQLTHFMDLSANQEPYFFIHNSCTSLLTAMAIVSCPLEPLYKIYKKGFIKKYANVTVGEASRGKNTDWLSFIHPALFTPQQKNLESLQTTSTIYLQLNLLQSQPDPSFVMLLQTLIMKDYRLAIMILTQPVDLLQCAPRSQPSVDDDTSCRKVCCLEADCLANWKRRVDNLYVPFITVLIKCGYDALSKVLVPVIERSSTWSVFDVDCVPGRTCDIPPWLAALYRVLTPFVNRILAPVLRIVLHETTPPLEPLWNHLEELPCGCTPELIGDSTKPIHPVNDEQVSGAETVDDNSCRDVMYRAMTSLVTTLAEEMYSLPAGVCTLFQVIQQKHSANSTNCHHCVGLMVLANCLRMKLSDHVHLEQITGSKISADGRTQLNLLAESLHSLLANFVDKNKPATSPALTAAYVRYNRDWLGEKLHFVQEYFRRPYFRESHHAAWDHTGDYSIQYITPAISDLMETSDGRRSLGRIYNLLMNNINWLLNQLDIRPPLCSPDESPPATASIDFDPIVSLAKPPEFNPIKDVSMTGNLPFDQEKLQDYPIDWMTLLQSDQGLSELGFRQLLFNRHDMQEGAYLEQNEVKPVSVLKSKYGGKNE